MASDMSIDVSSVEGRVPVTVFHIKGDIDVNSYEDLQFRVKEAYDGGARNLLLDLSEVGYISSAGLRAINSIVKLLQANSPEESDQAISRGLRDGTFKSPHVKLLKPQASVQKVLKTSGFDMFVESYNNLKDAVASF
jgi:anti-anti-sigma factor